MVVGGEVREEPGGWRRVGDGYETVPGLRLQGYCGEITFHLYQSKKLWRQGSHGVSAFPPLGEQREQVQLVLKAIFAFGLELVEMAILHKTHTQDKIRNA